MKKFTKLSGTVGIALSLTIFGGGAAQASEVQLPLPTQDEVIQVVEEETVDVNFGFNNLGEPGKDGLRLIHNRWGQVFTFVAPVSWTGNPAPIAGERVLFSVYENGEIHWQTTSNSGILNNIYLVQGLAGQLTTAGAYGEVSHVNPIPEESFFHLSESDSAGLRTVLNYQEQPFTFRAPGNWHGDNAPEPGSVVMLFLDEADNIHWQTTSQSGTLDSVYLVSGLTDQLRNSGTWGIPGQFSPQDGGFFSLVLSGALFVLSIYFIVKLVSFNKRIVASVKQELAESKDSENDEKKE